MKKPDRKSRRAALRIITIYALFSALWIYFSDTALGILIQNKSILVELSVFKGFLFIIITAAILYRLIITFADKTIEAEKGLRTSQNLINSLVEGTTDAVFVKDLQGCYILINSATADYIGKRSEDVIGKNDSELFTAEEADLIMKGDRKVMAEGKVITYEDYVTSADGIHRTFLSTKGPIYDENGEMSGLFGIARDITDRKKEQEELLETSRRLQLAVNSGHLGIWDWDITNNVMVWNDRMFELYGVSRDAFPICRDSIENAIHHEDRRSVFSETLAALDEKRDCDFEFRVVRPDGSTSHVKSSARVITNDDGEVVGMIGMNQDITERKNLEEQFRQSQKMEAIGRLAGGIAHDFNNILTAIYGYCSVLQLKVGKDVPYRAEIDNIYSAAERAANLTRSLLAFSRKQIMTPRSINLNEIVKNVVKLLIRIIGEDIRLKTEYMTDPLCIFADSGQIEQVLINLAANARDAMPDGGILTIETRSFTMDKGFPGPQGPCPAGRYAVMSVSDTGKGMDHDTAKKIFDPFYTTKEIGKGTGLGLAIVYGVIKQHNGFVEVQSQQGHGTVFRIYLPLSGAETCGDDEKVNIEPPEKGCGTALIAEDDPAIREFAESILTNFGYEVLVARDGVEAVEKFKESAEKIDIIIMDIIMPKMTGREALEKIRQIRPGVRALFISGYSPELLQSKGFMENGEVMLIKPFNTLDLLRKVKSMVDA